jgi:hypothetical protein
MRHNLASYHAFSDVANGVAIIFGGLLYDHLNQGGDAALTLYAQLFLWGWVARSAIVCLIARMIEPTNRPTQK